jgi:hypothetical protein
MVDAQIILNILTQSKPANNKDPKYQYYKTLANWALAHHRQQKLKNIELDKIKLSSRELITKGKLANRLTTLGHTLDALKNLMDKEGRYNPDSELSNLIQQTTLEILAGLSGIKDNTKPPEDPEDTEDEDPEDEPSEETDKSGRRDWTAYRAEKLANAKSAGKTTSKVLNEFYDEYYSQEYAGVESPEKDTKGIVAKLKSLDKILIPEFNKLGYNPEANPFAQFLKILIENENKFNIFTKLTFNTYGAIHNSFIDKKVTGNMLGNYNEGNILFCDDLYNKNGLDIVEYLSLQSQALAKAERNDKYSNSKNQLIAVLFIQQKPLKDSYKENIAALLDAKNIILPAARDAKVKSLLEVQELYRYIFGENPKTKVNIDDIVARAVNNDVVLSMVQRLIDQDDLEREYKKDVQELTTWLVKELKYTRNGHEREYDGAKDILSKYSLDTATKRSLALKLQNYYNKNVRDKKAGG